jgi:AcrR family transcriptional regulator
MGGVHRSLREKQRQERLELILQAAEQVFAEKGYRDTSMDEIAARVGIGTATIYSHFTSKEDLMVAAILDNSFHKIVQGVQALCATEGNATAKLTRIFHFLVSSDFFLRRATVAYSMGDSPAAQKARFSRQDAILESSRVFSRELATLIEQGKASGEFQRRIATATMLRAFIALVRAQSVKDQLLLYDDDNSADELLQVYLQGIAEHVQQDADHFIASSWSHSHM